MFVINDYYFIYTKTDENDNLQIMMYIGISLS